MQKPYRGQCMCFGFRRCWCKWIWHRITGCSSYWQGLATHRWTVEPWQSPWKSQPRTFSSFPAVALTPPPQTQPPSLLRRNADADIWHKGNPNYNIEIIYPTKTYLSLSIFLRWAVQSTALQGLLHTPEECTARWWDTRRAWNSYLRNRRFLLWLRIGIAPGDVWLQIRSSRSRWFVRL